jgi:predicted N-acetyltransferase YhbS
MEIINLSRCPEHTDTVARWIFAEWADRSELTLDEVLRHLADQPTRPPTLLAVDGERVLGVLGFRRVKYRGREPAVLFINSLFVAESSRNRGIGSALVSEALRRVGPEDAALYVYTDIRAWYESRDFQLVDQETGTGNAVLRRAIER